MATNRLRSFCLLAAVVLLTAACARPQPVSRAERPSVVERAERAPPDRTRRAEWTEEPGRADLCALPQGFDDPYPVLHDGSRSLFWVRPMEVDADGAPNAYHRDDPHGKKGLAIEHIGYGMRIENENGKRVPFVANEEDNQTWLDVYWKIVENGWKAPPGYSVEIYGFAKDENGEVCVRPDGGLVSSTSLNLKRDGSACDQDRYIDALKFPGIVVPNRAREEEPVENADSAIAPPFAIRGLRRGDLAVAYHPGTGNWRGAFIHDTGPRDKLGEGSIRLIMNLSGRMFEPKSAAVTNSMALREVYYLVFPGSIGDLGDKKDWTPAKIQKAAAARFRHWGGGSTKVALKRLAACAEKYKRLDERTLGPLVELR